MTHSAPRSDLAAHEVDNQPVPRAGFDLWQCDPVLRDHVALSPAKPAPLAA